MQPTANQNSVTIEEFPSLTFAILSYKANFLTLVAPVGKKVFQTPQLKTKLKTQLTGYLDQTLFDGELREFSITTNLEGTFLKLVLHCSVDNHKLTITSRKDEHIHICASEDIEHSARHHGFDDYRFVPTTLSELSFDAIDTKAQFLGRTFSYPLFVTAMTGGTELAAKINHLIAHSCAYLNIPMGVGSQRVALENPELANTFQMKEQHPELFLMGNLGISEFASLKALERSQQAIEMIQADALCVHGNLLQELIQPEGKKDFRNIWKHLEQCAAKLPVPLIFKEVGSGIDIRTARRLQDSGIQALDVGGAGGTSWGYIESIRAQDIQLGKEFQNWGIPTAHSLKTLTSAKDITLPITATGGIRSGLNLAKAIHLGASMVGVGLPILRAAMEDIEKNNHNPPATLSSTEALKHLIRGLKITQHLTASQTLKDLTKPHLMTHKTP